METKVIWVGVNPNNNIWGYLKNNDEWHAHSQYYSFWGKLNGCLRFSRIYYNSEFWASRRKKEKVYTQLPMSELNVRIIDEFNQLMVIDRLKYNHY